MTQEALKLALEALEFDSFYGTKKQEAITAIKEALAKPEQEVDWEKLYRLEVKKKEALAAKYERDIKPLTRIVPMAQPEQEPVAWKETDEVECPVCKDKGFPWPKCGHITYLEPTPPQRTWVGLTDEDKKQIAKEANYHWEMTAGEYAERIGQLTEAKLKEKNT